MAEEKPSLHVDSDWKKQAQEEKRKLAEQEQQRKAAAPPPAPAGVVAGAAKPSAPAAAGGRAAGRAQQRGELPQASLETLIQSILTQVLFYLGEISNRGMEPVVNFEMARHNLDTLGVLEEKTQNNLSPEEKQLLDGALYEGRMRFVGLASRYAELP